MQPNCTELKKVQLRSNDSLVCTRMARSPPRHLHNLHTRTLLVCSCYDLLKSAAPSLPAKAASRLPCFIFTFVTDFGRLRSPSSCRTYWKRWHDTSELGSTVFLLFCVLLALLRSRGGYPLHVSVSKGPCLLRVSF